MSFNKRYQIHLTLYHRQSKALSCNKASSCSWERPCYVDSAIRNYKHLFGLSIHCKSIPNCSQLTSGIFEQRVPHQNEANFPPTPQTNAIHIQSNSFSLWIVASHICAPFNIYYRYRFRMGVVRRRRRVWCTAVHCHTQFF